MSRRCKIGCCVLIGLALLVTYVVMSLMFPGLHDFIIVLPGGYELWRPHSQGNFIADSHSCILIGAYVDRYRVVKHLVIGHVTPESTVVVKNPWPQEVTGYFILDTKTGKIRKGMTEKNWASALRIRGVPTPPKLWRPNMFHAWLSKIGIR